MFGFLGGGGGGGGRGGGSKGKGQGQGQGQGGGGRRRWWSLTGGAGVLDEDAEDAAVVLAAPTPPPRSSSAAASSTAGAVAAAAAASSGGARRRGRGAKEPELSDIERLRQENLRQNQAFLQSLGIGQARAALAEEDGGKGEGGAGATTSGGGGRGQGRKRKRGRGSSTGAGGPRGRGSSIPTLEQVARKWVGREEQIRTLARLLPVSPAAAAASGGALSAEEGGASPVLLVHGPSGTGKTGVLRDLLPALRLPHAYVRGPEHATARSLYGAVAAAWMRFIEAQARALGMEGLGYVAGADDLDVDYAEEEARALKQARREERQRREAGEGSGTEDEGPLTGDEDGGWLEEDEDGSDAVSDDEDEDEEDEDEEDAYWRQAAPLSHAGASLVPLNRVGTASGLLHLLRSWRGFNQHQRQQQHQHSLSPAEVPMTPFVVVLDGADRLPRGAAQARHELVRLPAMLAGARGRGGGFTGGASGGGGGGGSASLSSPLVALTVVLVSESPFVAPGALEAGYGLPVPFPAYGKAEATAILLRSLRIAAGLPSSSSASASASASATTSSSSSKGGRRLGKGREGSSSSSLSLESEFEALASAFASLLVGSLYASTRDVREMRRMAALLSHTYLQPLFLPQTQQQPQPQPALSEGGDGGNKDKDKENGRGQSGDEGGGGGPLALAAPSALLERIRPLLARATQHCLHLPAEPLEPPTTTATATAMAAVKAKAKAEGPGPLAAAAAAAMAVAPPSVTRLEALLRYELPALARFLVVAAYLAGHVAPDTDLFLFAAGSSSSSSGKAKKRSSAKQAVRQERQAEEREAEAEKAGARAFSLERLLSIFTCLLASSRAQGAAYANSTGTTELFAQVNALVHHRLLTRLPARGIGGGAGGTAGPPPELTAAKFKCNVGYELVRETARELEIKLDMYIDASRTHSGGAGAGGGGSGAGGGGGAGK